MKQEFEPKLYLRPNQQSAGWGREDIFSNAEKAYDGYTQIYKLFKEALEQSQKNKECDFKKHEIKAN